MPELRDDVLDEAFHQGEALLVNDLVALVEKHHDAGEYGARIDLVESYVARLGEEDARFEPEAVRTAIEERLADGDSWTGTDSLYDVGEGRVSTYPRKWHEQLADEDDVLRYVEVITNDLPNEGRDSFPAGGQGPGIPRQRLIDITQLVGHADESDVKRRLQELGDEGKIDAYAEEHPNQRIHLA